MKEKNPWRQLLLVDAAILAGLILEYFRRLPFRAIVIAGVFMLAMSSLIFFIRLQKEKKAQ